MGLAVGVSTATLELAGVFERWEVVTLDARFRLRGQHPLDERISVVLADEDTLNSLGWPLPRSAWAALVDAAFANGARAVGFDLLFTDPGREAEQDQALAMVAGDSKRVVFPAQLGAEEADVQPPAVYLDDCPTSGGFAITVPRAATITPPIAVLAKQSAGAAHVQLDPRPDGVFRGLPLFLEYRGRLVPALALRLVALYRDVDLAALDKSVQAQAYLNFKSVGRGVRTAGLAEILKSRRQQVRGEKPLVDLGAFFRDKLVLVGQSAASVGDRGPTPFSTDSPLVMVHANAADNLLRDDFLSRIPPWANAAVVLVLGLVVALLLTRLRAMKALSVVFFLAAGYLAASFWTLAGAGIWVDIVGPLAVVMLATLVVGSYNLLVRDARERLLKAAFERYVAPGVLKKILDHADDVDLSGNLKRVTILFSDIKGYTSLSNRLEPPEVVGLLGEYMRVMTEVLHEHGGWVDKIMGDGIMAVFGDPLPAEDHARLAVDAALEMQRRQSELQHKWQREGKAGLEMRVGVATGEVFVGNIGSSYHVEYTAIGRAVNLAARLEAAAPPGGILISHETKNMLGDGYDVTLLDGLELKGFESVTSAWLLENTKLEEQTTRHDT